MAAAEQHGLLRSPYTIALSTRASHALRLLTPAQRAALAPRVVLLASDRVVPSNELQALLKTKGYLGLSAPYSVFVGGMEMSHAVLGAAVRQLNSFGFGVDRSRTANALATGLDSMTGDEPLPGVLFNFILFQNRVAKALQYMVARDDALDELVTIVVLLADGGAPILRSSVFNVLDTPTDEDYALLRGQTTAGDEDHSDLWWLAMIVVAVAVVVALLYWRRRHNRRAKLSRKGQLVSETTEHILSAMELHGRAPLVLPEVERSQVRLRRTMRVGNFGQIYTAAFHSGVLGDRLAKVMVVAKLWQMAGGGDDDALAEGGPRGVVLAQLLLECQVLHQFCGEPHLAEVYALIVHNERPIGVAMEYFQNGTLAELLVRETPPDETKLRMAREIADGMRAVSEAGAMHMELAASHVLLTEDKRCKLAHVGVWIWLVGQGMQMIICREKGGGGGTSFRVSRKTYIDLCNANILFVLLE